MCKELNKPTPLCLDLTKLMLYTYSMALKRTTPNNKAASDLLMDIATGAIAALLLVVFALMVPTI